AQGGAVRTSADSADDRVGKGKMRNTRWADRVRRRARYCRSNAEQSWKVAFMLPPGRLVRCDGHGLCSLGWNSRLHGPAASTKQESQHEPGDESADVRHVGDTTTRPLRAGEGADAAEQLQNEPEAD